MKVTGGLPNAKSKIDLVLGQLVRSKQGRDQGKFYLVYAIDGTTIWLIDGRKRSVSNPKKKNRCHLQHFNKVAADLVDLLVNEKPVTNEDVREAISRLLVSSD
ncbi:MAG: RNA-binding protein [Bacillota bacterium]|jgi:large subunit ribosomal protein L14e